ncbi:uncharacterized protein TNCV_886311 [Trichonephila clavipes]|nr:uncharacterized protein TNCV_886311 [Trichonephila clavipes]
MKSHTCSIGDRYGYLEGQSNMPTICGTRLNYQTDVQICSQCVWDNHKNTPAVTGNYSPNHNSRRRLNVSRPQTIWLQVFPWSLPDQHSAITGTKKGPAFIRNHNRSPLCSPISSGLTPLASQTTMAWSQRNTCYWRPGQIHLERAGHESVLMTPRKKGIVYNS